MRGGEESVNVFESAACGFGVEEVYWDVGVSMCGGEECVVGEERYRWV